MAGKADEARDNVGLTEANPTLYSSDRHASQHRAGSRSLALVFVGPLNLHSRKPLPLRILKQSSESREARLLQLKEPTSGPSPGSPHRPQCRYKSRDMADSAPPQFKGGTPSAKTPSGPARPCRNPGRPRIRDLRFPSRHLLPETGAFAALY